MVRLEETHDNDEQTIETTHIAFFAEKHPGKVSLPLSPL
jgi:hypothetical protein